MSTQKTTNKKIVPDSSILLQRKARLHKVLLAGFRMDEVAYIHVLANHFFGVVTEVEFADAVERRHILVVLGHRAGELGSPHVQKGVPVHVCRGWRGDWFMGLHLMEDGGE